MLRDIVIPALGDTPDNAKIIAWHKQEGESIRRGELLLELETEKANIELNAEYSGKLHKGIKQAGETGAPMEVIGILASIEVISTEKPTQAFKPFRQQKQKKKRKQSMAYRTHIVDTHPF